MINKVILIGNLGADPEARTAQTGTTVTKLRIATTERVKDRDGNWNDHTEWHRVTCFGKTAENTARFLRKGRQVFIEGRLRTSKYTDRDGVERWSTEIIADNVRFLGKKDEGGYAEGPSQGYAPPSGGSRPPASNLGGTSGGGGGTPDDDDIPF